MTAEHADPAHVVAPWSRTRLRLLPPAEAQQPLPVRGVYVTVVKRAVDVLVAATLLLVLLPLLVGLALLVRHVLGRPVLFRQRRTGLGGRTFTVLKFRTMGHDRRRRAADWDGVERRRTHKSDEDPRHTPLGRFLRATSLDELPQLINVLRGDMSLVGPRPELESVVAGYAPWQHRRHVVRPGLTGLWQISDRGSRPMHEATELDLRYVDSLGLRTDLTILAKTPAVLLKRTGA